MEVSFRQDALRGLAYRDDSVSILVLMEVSFRLSKGGRFYRHVTWVSILVLMEVSFRPQEWISREIEALRFQSLF